MKLGRASSFVSDGYGVRVPGSSSSSNIYIYMMRLIVITNDNDADDTDIKYNVFFGNT